MATAAAARGSVEILAGRLLLADGRPAAGYVVAVVGGAVAVPCDANGLFRIDPAPVPPFRVVATGPNGELSLPIEIERIGAETFEIRLPEIVRDSLTVVSGIAPGLDLLPANAATVVSAEALEQRPAQRLVDALDSVAGASKLGEGADSVPVLRGLARGRTLVLVDGARVSAERRAGPSATFVDPASLAALEIVRGPGSVVYGSDALGGVLNAVTRDPVLGTSMLRFSLAGTVGGESQWNGSVAGSSAVGAGALLVEAHVTDAENSEAGGSEEIFNSSFAARGGALRYVLPSTHGRLRASLQLDRVRDLGKPAIDSRAVRAFYPSESSERLVLSWLGSRLGEWDSLEATLFAGRYRIELDRDRAATADASRRIDSSDTRARDAQLRGVAGRQLAGGALKLGLDLHSRFDLESRVGRADFAADGVAIVATRAELAIEDARQRSSGMFVSWSRAAAERWTLGLGVRADRVEARNRGGFFGDRSEVATALSGNLALTFAPTPSWSSTVQLARGFRAPTLSDRYFRGPSGRGFVTGNPALDPESSRQLDGSIRRLFEGGTLALFAYHYEIDELIERLRVGDDFVFRNRGGATFQGVELEMQSRLGERWSLETGAALSRSRGDGGGALDDGPAPSLFVGARYAEARGFVYGRIAISDDKGDPGPTEIPRPGYSLVDLGAGWRIVEELELRIAVQNAFNRSYTGSPDETADRSPGRAITLALSGNY